ncbi:uncharacterized protein LOC120841278 isoform X2 [Ixodes scapularis]|nr:uncharacterized protein LOC120841278 isoform X2 [Ixodes scapularis]
MGTSCASRAMAEDTGIIPRAVQDIFAAVGECRASKDFLEIYKEDILDLLRSQDPLATCEDNRSGVEGTWRQRRDHVKVPSCGPRRLGTGQQDQGCRRPLPRGRAEQPGERHQRAVRRERPHPGIQS